MQIAFIQINRHAHGVWSRPCRIAGLKTALAGMLFLAELFISTAVSGATIPAGQSVTLAWNANSDASVAGYNIYYGVTSGTYTSQVNAGNVTSATVHGLVVGATYYFSATTYDASGDESGYAGEISYTVPAPSATLQLRRAPAGQFILTVTGLAGQTYQILATQDLTAWTVIGAVTAGADGSLEFTDTYAANYPQRFYRTRAAQ